MFLSLLPVGINQRCLSLVLPVYAEKKQSEQMSSQKQVNLTLILWFIRNTPFYIVKRRIWSAVYKSGEFLACK